MTKPTYSIIIPAKNEEKRIGRTLERYIRFFRKAGSFEIYVIMDGCTDNTLGVVQRLAKMHPQLKYKSFRKALGKGGGIIEGMKRF